VIQYNKPPGLTGPTRTDWRPGAKAAARRFLHLRVFEGVPASYELCVPAIKYFTAPILKSFSRSDDSVACQAQYHNALRGHRGDAIQIVMGYYDARPARAHAWVESKVARECGWVEIWKLEEKQSDVALALHAFADAIRNDVDQIIIVTDPPVAEVGSPLVDRDPPAVNHAPTLVDRPQRVVNPAPPHVVLAQALVRRPPQAVTLARAVVDCVRCPVGIDRQALPQK
jgi:hypothetical protein